MGVLFCDVSDAEQAYLRERLPGEETAFHAAPLTEPGQIDESAAGADILSVFVKSRVGADVLAALPALRCICTRSTGYDHIDLEAAAARGIVVCNVPAYGENTVAEHTFALILALSRNLHRAYVRTTMGNFSLEGLQGFDLKGKTIGVVGVGHIGLHVVRIARGFGMRVLGHDPYPNATLADLLEFTYTPLEDLLAQSDIVSLHAPLTPETRHMIGRHNFPLFKRGALLINTARGGLVDTQAMLQALDEGILSGAGLDVLEGEEILSEEKQLLGAAEIPAESLRTVLANMILMRRPDMVITPHIGFDSREAVQRILDTTVENIRAFRQGRPRNVVSPRPGR